MGGELQGPSRSSRMSGANGLSPGWLPRPGGPWSSDARRHGHKHLPVWGLHRGPPEDAQAVDSPPQNSRASLQVGRLPTSLQNPSRGFGGR